MTPTIIVKENVNKVQGIICTNVYGVLRLNVCSLIDGKNADLNSENITFDDISIPLANGDRIHLEVNETFVKWFEEVDGLAYGSIQINFSKEIECEPEDCLIACNYMFREDLIDQFKLDEYITEWSGALLEVNEVIVEWICHEE